jgi:hypothetical protein
VSWIEWKLAIIAVNGSDCDARSLAEGGDYSVTWSLKRTSEHIKR